MARTKTTHTEKKSLILQAAIKTFAQYGYEGTTNKLIAAEVRRSSGSSFTPALIYHYFPEGKLQLLSNIMQQYSPLQELGRAVREQTDSPPDVFLPAVAYAYIRLFDDPETARLFRIFFTEGPRYPELVQGITERIFPLIMIPMVQYLQRQVQQGTIKPVQPLAAVFQFFGPLLMRGLLKENLNTITPPFPMPSDQEMIENHVQTFLHGLLTRNN